MSWLECPCLHCAKNILFILAIYAYWSMKLDGKCRYHCHPVQFYHCYVLIVAVMSMSMSLFDIHTHLYIYLNIYTHTSFHHFFNFILNHIVFSKTNPLFNINFLLKEKKLRISIFSHYYRCNFEGLLTKYY